MKLPIAEVAERIRAKPGPVLIVDSCNFLNLFEADGNTPTPVGIVELKAAIRIHDALADQTRDLHLVVPELVPLEVRENSERVKVKIESWLRRFDTSRDWLSAVCEVFGREPPTFEAVSPLRLEGELQNLANNLLGQALVLARDGECLKLAVERVIEKRLPSSNENQQLKDSMNLEQALALCRLLDASGTFAHPKCFISSDTSGYGEKGKDDVHEDLKAEFDTVGLGYFKSFQAARGYLIRSYPNLRD
jgi:hypothetical protein